MIMHKVSGEYVQGVTALVDLMKVMEAALTECIDELHFVRTGGFGHCGYLINNKYFFGVRYQNPTLLTFENNMGYPPKTFERRLNLQTANFFSMSEGEQFERIVGFVLEAWLKAEPHPSPSGD